MYHKGIALFFACLLLINITTYAQQTKNISGTISVKNEKGKKEYIQGAVVAIPGSGVGTQTNNEGKFTLSFPDSFNTVVASYIGYRPDTTFLKQGVNVLNIELIMPHTLKEVVVREKLKSTELSLLDPIKTEKIGQGELMKAACCNLSESFETTPSVDVAFTDAVTGYKQVRMLGLAGPYTLITRENIPDVRGLAAITGMTFTPGTWIEGMQLSKGTGSVVNGSESVAGQINIELRKPFDGEKWLYNIYQSTQGRSEANVNYRHKFKGDKLGTNLLVHANSQWLKTDQNKDHFIDQPLGNQFNILNRWIWSGPKGWMLQAGVKFLYAQGVGGEWDYKPGEAQVPGNPWGYQFNTTRLEDWAKIAKVFSRPATSIGLQLSNTNHDQDAKYGPREYIGIQNSLYANLIFQTYIGNTNHIIKAGVSSVMDVYNEQFALANYNRNEQVSGVFTEYAYNFSTKFNMVAGMRGDHNNLYGAYITPRLHLRYAPFKRTTIRASIGRAQRTANIFAENAGFMAGNRQFDILDHASGKAYGLDPEVAWNTGMNLTHKFKIGLRDAVLSMDYYYTWFESQVVTDIDNTGFVLFYNLQGRSFAHSFSTQFDYELLHNLNLRLAYRYYNVMTTYQAATKGGVLEEKPLVPANRAFANIDYEIKKKWKFDYTIQWLGTQRTPGITHEHSGFSPGGVNYSPSYITMNAQVTKVISDIFEVYLGGENLTNYMQHDAIIGVSNPYGPSFDASMIWGPMMGRNIYMGLRYKIK
jgi:outer membrane receptor for ferrienterochelin and colicin